jgi:hypothetical protein
VQNPNYSFATPGSNNLIADFSGLGNKDTVTK